MMRMQAFVLKKNLKMIQQKTKLTLKDNSGFLNGVCINTPAKWQTLAGLVTLALIQRKKAKLKLTGAKSKPNKNLTHAVLIQTKKSWVRYDGSSLKFNTNGCATLAHSGGRGDKKLMLGFKRISTVVPFELKKSHNLRQSNVNLIKLARGSF